MDRHEEKTHARRTARIRMLNDQLRTTGEGGRFMVTKAVSDLGWDQVRVILAAVRLADGFNANNDPWGEHDFGQVEVDGERYFWKIDYYDLNLEYGSVDPSDETITCRVLTVMTASDL